jgi:hypothetical protein
MKQRTGGALPVSWILAPFPLALSLSLALSPTLGCSEGPLPAPQDATTVAQDAGAPSPDLSSSTPPAPKPAGPDAGDGAAVQPSAPLPCAIEAVVKARCGFCHSSPERFGAPMSLLAMGDFTAPAHSNTSKQVWELARTKIESGAMPPANAPGGPLSASEKATLLEWLGSSGPTADSARPATCPDAGAPSEPTVQTELPCTPDYEFRAQGATAGSAFPVPVLDNHYACFAIQVPFTAGEQAVAWGPLIDNAQLIHHWILYDTKSTTKPVGCGTNRTFLMGWAPGGSTWVMPSDVGLELPDPGQWMVLEAHYNNVAKVPGAVDRSGVAVCTTKTERPKKAGVITFGTTRLVLPADQEMDLPVTGECSSLATRTLSQPLHILGAWPHMHTLGVRFRTDLIGAGGTRTLVDVPKWDFNSQTGYPRDPAEWTINAGDRVVTTCTYRNDTGKVVRFGERTEDEMCLNFTMVYPIQAAAALDRVPLRLCSF